MNEFPSPHHRIRRILETAIAGECTYVSSEPEDAGSTFVLRLRRDDGREIGVRFRGLKEPGSVGGPEPGAPVRVRSVSSTASVFSRMLPLPFRPMEQAYARVTIDAGPATLVIVCQDAEWWEE